MTLKTAIYGYLTGLHLLALFVAFQFHTHLGLGFFLVEALIIASAAISLWMVRKALAPLELISSFTGVLAEKEFSTRFSPVGVAELDRMIRLYNRMLADLYQQRVHLGEQRGFVEKFLGAAPVGVIMLDFDDQISLINPTGLSLLGRQKETVLGRRLRQLGSHLAKQLHALAAGDTQVMALDGLRRIRAEHVTYVDRGFSRSFFLLEELTELLNESERRAYERLIRMMSHEVNNTVAATNSLLASCRSYAPQLQHDDREDFTEALDVVIRRSEHLNRFMKGFASVVKLPAPRLEEVDLPAMLTALSRMFAPQAEGAGVQWENDSTDGCIVRADPEQLEQALINVMKNALEASPSRTSVTVRLTTSPDATATLEILDQGTGIESTHRDQLFSPFATSKPGGQGLGLTLVREILSRHDWRFGLDNRADEPGAKFWLQMPVIAPKAD